MGSMRKVTSVEDLVLLHENGVKVKCDHITWLERPRKIDNVLKLSVRSVLDIIAKGLYAMGEDEGAMEDSVLVSGKRKIRSTGLSQKEISTRVGVSQQAVQQFMAASSVQTRVLDKYLKALELT